VSFLLDTDICSAHMKGNPRVQARFIQYGGQLHVSTVTLGELFAWTGRAKSSPRRLQTLLHLLKDLLVLAVNETVARKFGAVRAWQLDNGVATPDLDLLSAAVALASGLTLVTHNADDYARVPGLIVVDWLAP
jgi:predicted nucleic acid-binding protein